jgi:hypothetical protein
VFVSNSARHLVRRPQKRTKCYNKHSEKQRLDSPRHLSDIPGLKMAARPSTRMIAFFDAEGLVHHEFLPQRQTMNQTVYITVLQRLRDADHRKRPHKCLPVPGFCTTTMCHATRPGVFGNSWPSIASPWFPTHLTHQIWPVAISSSSPG